MRSGLPKVDSDRIFREMWGMDHRQRSRCTDTADYVVVESTYGNQVHSSEKIDYVSEFTRILKKLLMRAVMS